MFVTHELNGFRFSACHEADLHRECRREEVMFRVGIDPVSSVSQNLSVKAIAVPRNRHRYDRPRIMADIVVKHTAIDRHSGQRFEFIVKTLLKLAGGLGAYALGRAILSVLMQD